MLINKFNLKVSFKDFKKRLSDVYKCEYTHDGIKTIYNYLNNKKENIQFDELHQVDYVLKFWEFDKFYCILDSLIKTGKLYKDTKEIFNKNDTQNKIEEDCKKFIENCTKYKILPIKSNKNKKYILVL